jgi:hypothetical protein
VEEVELPSIRLSWVVVAVGGVVERERERRERTHCRKTGEGGWFFVNFGLDFLPLQAMKSTKIYRGWKRVILSTLEKKFGP